jgi:hypothetical protein
MQSHLWRRSEEVIARSTTARSVDKKLIPNRPDPYGRREADGDLPRGPFRGVPTLYKDVGCTVAGEPTGFGLGPLREMAWPVTSYLAEQFRAAGFAWPTVSWGMAGCRPDGRRRRERTCGLWWWGRGSLACWRRTWLSASGHRYGCVAPCGRSSMITRAYGCSPTMARWHVFSPLAC